MNQSSAPSREQSSRIILHTTKVVQNKVSFSYEMTEDLTPFFDPNTAFFYEYLFPFDFTKIPVAVLNIPFVMNLMPLVWFGNVQLSVETLDKAFYDCLEEIKAGIQRVYPKAHLGGMLNVGTLVDCSYQPQERYTAFFTGGADASATLINQIEKKPELFYIWGADRRLEDAETFEETRRYISKTANDLGLFSFFIKSPVRYFYDGTRITNYFWKTLKDSWWHGAQHSIGMVSLMAPYAYANKIKTHFIASSFTKEAEGKIHCISFPFIDNALRFSSTTVYHDGYELSRQEKINKIVEFCRSKHLSMEMKVCFSPKDGINCNHCEKCMRTIMAIVAAGDDPNKYGFSVNNETFIEIQNYLSTHLLYHTAHWKAIRDEFRKSKEKWETDKRVAWILGFRFNPLRIYIKFAINKIKRMLLRR